MYIYIYIYTNRLSVSRSDKASNSLGTGHDHTVLSNGRPGLRYPRSRQLASLLNKVTLPLLSCTYIHLLVAKLHAAVY
jgi:hypothetical protein